MVAVTANLESAPQRLRRLGIKRIWVDTLYINQSGNREKSLPVRNMMHVYTWAGVVFSCLGGPKLRSPRHQIFDHHHDLADVLAR